MSKMAKALLVLAIGCLVLGGALNIGFVNEHGMDALYAVLPTGAVFAGLFLIVHVLEKESAIYDQEQEVHDTDAQSSGVERPTASGKASEQAQVGTNMAR